MNLMALPDDPSRVASPHQGPCEYEPPDPPVIKRAQAVRDVRAVLLGDSDDAAYGLYADEWTEWLVDEMARLNNARLWQDLAHGVSAADLISRYPNETEPAIERRVNELVAEMDPEELEMMR